MLNRETELSILYEISSLPARLRDLPTIFAVALDKVTRLLGTEIAIVYFREGDEGGLTARAAQGVLLKKALPAIPPAAEAELGRQTQAAAPGEPPLPVDPLGGRYPVTAAIGVPIRVGDELLGWLYAARIKGQPFDATEQSLFTILGKQLGGTLEPTLSHLRDLRHQQALEENNRRLEQMLAEITSAHEQQRYLIQTIRELSTPILNIAESIVLLPLIGHIDSERIGLIATRLLAAVSDQRARICIIDITGVAGIDTHVANGLLQLATAARLLGAEVILCGIIPDVAQTVVSLGLKLETIQTTSDLQGALRLSFRMLGKAIVDARAAGAA
ncbi:MAG TPA: STAS domain-containing protein [Herpetosiphonaceae bacterium]